MAAIDDLLRRVADDPAFRTRCRTDPRAALADHDLSADDLRRLDHAVRAHEERATSRASPWRSRPAGS